ncbi:MAG TPA: zf-HC2 domain-containing protein [Terriglobales bacterium]|nr:zf-HC2 domain-containing protein [Terriglobales bacterium]
MTCGKTERLILDSEDRPLDASERQGLDAHLRDCARCRAFAAGRRALRGAAADLRWPATPASVGTETRRLCLEELAGAEAERARRGPRRARVPVPVAVAASLFTVLAAVWIAGVLADLKPGEAIPAMAWLAVAVIAQNVLALFLTPVVLGAGRPDGDQGPRSAQRV